MSERPRRVPLAPREERDRLVRGEHWNPHAILGAHEGQVAGSPGVVVRAFHPDAVGADCLLEDGTETELKPDGEGGLFTTFLKGAELPLRYRVRFRFADGNAWERDDPYRAAITIGGERGNFELNVMIPVMVHNLLESIEILASGSRTFADRCVAGITANAERCRRNAESTASLSTVLAPTIGYDKAAEVAKKSLKEDKTLREVVREMQLMSDEELDSLLDFAKMTAPNVT